MKYIIPGMIYENGSGETFSVVERSRLPRYEALCQLARADREDVLHYSMSIWHHILNEYTSYRDLEAHFRDWFESWPSCPFCTALRASDEPHGLDLQCAACLAIVDARGWAHDKWLRAAELGIAHWASQQWPELDIYNATSGPFGYEPGFSDDELKAAPLEVWKPPR